MDEKLRPLTSLLSWLEHRSISVWVFGGWGEELRGLSRPRAHSDIDLLYPHRTWNTVDALIDDEGLEEIVAKRFAHKRAIVWRGIMVELFLVDVDVDVDRGRPHTLFWNRVRHDWPADVLGCVGEIPVASATALRGYRAARGHICQGRDATTPPGRDGSLGVVTAQPMAELRAKADAIVATSGGLLGPA